MADPISQTDYDNAAAVFSRSFRFVEWRFVIAAERADGIPTPFGDRNEKRRKATVAFDRQKWIYVFRTNTQTQGVANAAIREEIRIDKTGEMAATPHDEIEKDVKKRGDPVALGKTMCLPRRILGLPQVYRFFASRVRLPLAQIKELESKITKFAPPVILDPDKNNSVIEQDGELLVPVVDPITVALHLHAAYSAAADDIVNYTTAYADNKHRRRVERRRKKHLLAGLLKSIIGEKGNAVGDNLVHELKDMQFPLEEFLTHYTAHLQWRVERRDWLAQRLTRWLQSDAVKIASAAHRASGAADWVKFLVPWCRAITRVSESPTGRMYLNQVVDDKQHFVHDYVWPEAPLSDDAIQAVRKSGMTVLEAWKSIVESRVVGYKPTELAELAQRTLGNLQRKQLWLVKYNFPVKSVSYGIGLSRAIDAVKLDASAVEPMQDHFSGKQRSPAIIIESVNLVFSIMAARDALKGDDPRAKELAIIGLVGSSLDAASAIGSLLKKSEKVVTVFSFVSGVIDVYLGHVEMDNAFKRGDQDAANGAFLTASGAAIGVSATLMPLLGIPGAQIVAVIGLLVVAIGFLFKFFTSKGPIEKFFAHCTWGKDYLKPGEESWSPKRFEQWQGDNEFDYQFQALLNIICKIEISKGAALRDVSYKMGWLPPDSKLTVKYEETWNDKAEMLEGEILVTSKGPTSSSSKFTVFTDGKNGVKVTPAGAYLPRQDLYVKGTFRDSRGGDVYDVEKVNPDLKKIDASGKLLVTFDGMVTVAIPHNGWEKKTIYDR